MKKTIFLDRDGTINIDNGYVWRIEDFAFLNNAIEGMLQMQKLGYQLVIVSNQSGIARGFYTESDYNKLTEYYLNELKKNGVLISKTYFCPHLKDATIDKYKEDCSCRKPKLGMFEQAIIECDVDIDKSFCVGDKPRDLSLCTKYPKVTGILITDAKVDDFHTAKDLVEAVEIIRRVASETVH